MLVIQIKMLLVMLAGSRIVKMEEILKLQQKIKDLEEELSIIEKLLEERNKLLTTIPACPLHGNECVPFAIDWVKEMLK